MKPIPTKLISGIPLILLLSTIALPFRISVIAKEGAPAIEIGSDGVLFAIGAENGDESEFQYADFEGIKDYECTVKVNYESKNFPAHIMRRSLADRCDYLGVAQVTINFNLSPTCEKVSLRIARKGTGTTIVELDDTVAHSVTSEMLESGPYQRYGSYDLGLGTLDAGMDGMR